MILCGTAVERDRTAVRNEGGLSVKTAALFKLIRTRFFVLIYVNFTMVRRCRTS